METAESLPETSPEDEAAIVAERQRKNKALLEAEGNAAADYLETLLDILDMDGDIDIYAENRRSAVSIVGDAVSTRRLKRLVGADGEVLDALQELTRLAVQTSTGERSRCMVDIAGHRAGIKEKLTKLAEDCVARVKETGVAMSLEPMTAFERKVVHDVIGAHDLHSHSEGEDPYRYIVIDVKRDAVPSE